MTTNPDNVRTRIRKAVEQALGIEIDPAEFAESDRLDDFLGLDSIAAMEIFVALETEFNFQFDESFYSTEKLGDLKALEAYLADRA